MEKDYLPELQPGEPAYCRAGKTSSSSELMSATMRRWTRYLPDQKPNMYFTLLASIGTESKKTILSQHAFYHVDCEQNSYSDVLAINISKTHYTYTEVSGDNPLKNTI